MIQTALLVMLVSAPYLLDAQTASKPSPTTALTISPAIRLSFLAQSNYQYQIESSADLKVWINAVPVLIGNGSELSQFFIVQTNAAAAYRLRAAPDTNAAPITLAGRIIDFTTRSGAAEN